MKSINEVLSKLLTESDRELKYKEVFKNYCKDKIEDLGTIEISDADLEDSFYDYTYRVAYVVPKFREAQPGYILQTEEGNEMVADKDGNVVFDGGAMASNIEDLVDLDFVKIDTEFYNDILNYWEDLGLEDDFELKEIDTNSRDKIEKEFKVPEGFKYDIQSRMGGADVEVYCDKQCDLKASTTTMKGSEHVQEYFDIDGLWEVTIVDEKGKWIKYDYVTGWQNAMDLLKQQYDKLFNGVKTESKQDNEEAQKWLDSKKYTPSDIRISDEEADYYEGAMIRDLDENYNVYSIQGGDGVYNSVKVDTVETEEQAEDRVAEIEAETGNGAYYEEVKKKTEGHLPEYKTTLKQLLDSVETDEEILDLAERLANEGILDTVISDEIVEGTFNGDLAELYNMMEKAIDNMDTTTIHCNSCGKEIEVPEAVGKDTTLDYAYCKECGEKMGLTESKVSSLRSTITDIEEITDKADDLTWDDNVSEKFDGAVGEFIDSAMDEVSDLEKKLNKAEKEALKTEDVEEHYVPFMGSYKHILGATVYVKVRDKYIEGKVTGYLFKSGKYTVSCVDGISRKVADVYQKVDTELEESDIFGNDTPDEVKAKADSKAKGLYTEAVDVKEVKEKVEDDIQNIGIEDIVDTENELKESLKKEIYAYSKQQGLDLEKLRKQGVELESIQDTIDTVIGDMVSKSVIEYMDATNKNIQWDFNVENNDIQVIIQ